jgi:haloalkane dehalogenase
VPFDGEPADTHQVISDYAAWLPTTGDLPKLWFDVSEGILVSGPRRDFARSLPGQQIVTVVGRHFVQEDSPDAIGTALAEWINQLP